MENNQKKTEHCFIYLIYLILIIKKTLHDNDICILKFYNSYRSNLVVPSFFTFCFYSIHVNLFVLSFFFPEMTQFVWMRTYFYRLNLRSVHSINFFFV